MAEVANDSVNPDISLLRDINDLARQAPRGFDRVVEFFSEYGLFALMAGLVLWCWWRVARQSADAPAAVAGVLWSVLAAGIALLLNVPIRALVQRPRPFDEHSGLDVLVHDRSGFSFVSGHATVMAALAIGLFMVSRKYGVIALLLALGEGFTRLYLGAHYPTDVIGGFALGAATTLLLAPLALALLTFLTTRATTTRAASLIHAHPATHPSSPPNHRPSRHHSADDKDLAA